VEWRVPCKHLVDKNAIAPPVNGEGVQISANNFRRKVLRSTAESMAFVVFRYVLAAHPEVGDSAMTLVVEQNVVKLQVSVHYFAFMEKFKAGLFFCGLKCRNFAG